MTREDDGEADDRTDEAAATGAGGGLSGGLVSRTEVQLGVLTGAGRREGDRGREKAAEDGRGKDGVEGPHLIPREV